MDPTSFICFLPEDFPYQNYEDDPKSEIFAQSRDDIARILDEAVFQYKMLLCLPFR